MSDLSNENVVHIHKNGVEYLQFRRLLQYPEIEHCYTLREKLNFRKYENDHILQESYEKICNALKLDKNNIVKPHQTHTDRVEIVEKNTQVFDEVDGLITDQKDIILCTTSADCTGLIFYDPVKKVIGNVHSGWRGTLQKIGQKTVKKMIDIYGSDPKDIICCICPHIRKCHFEVEEDVKELFEKEFNTTGRINEIITKGNIIDQNKQKYYIDTTLINKLILKEIGLKEENIIDSGICTVCHAESFHSYRVDKEQSGRNATTVCIIEN